MTAQSASSNVASDSAGHVSAFMILRIFLGLRTLVAGLEKFEANKSFSFSNYYENMNRMATGISGASVLPTWATKMFAMPLGYLLIAFGLAILLGVKTRCALLLGGLLYVSLSFGLMAVQEGEGVAWIGMQILMFAFALTLVRHNRFALVADKN